MSDYELVVESALDGVEHEFEGVTVSEVVGKSLVMVALPKSKFKEIESSMTKSCGLSLPEMEHSSQSNDSSITLWRLQKKPSSSLFFL